jgi:hypothetical protein
MVIQSASHGHASLYVYSNRVYLQMASNLRKSFKQIGFALGPSPVFSTPEQLVEYHAALVGPSANRIITQEQRKIVLGELERLFGIAMQHVDFYRVVRGARLFWDLISREWAIYGHLTSEDIQNIVDVYVAARKANKVEIQNKLTDLVDTWIVVCDRVAATGDPMKYQFTLGPGPSAQPATTLSSTSLSDGPYEVELPPSYLSIQERAWVADTQLAEALKDIFKHQGEFPFYPKALAEIAAVPHNLMSPRDIKFFLAYTAISQWNPYKSAARLYIPPIAFQDAQERKEWYTPMGSMSKIHSTLPEFLKYAKVMMEQERHSFIVGMLTYWIDEPGKFLR